MFSNLYTFEKFPEPIRFQLFFSMFISFISFLFLILSIRKFSSSMLNFFLFHLKNMFDCIFINFFFTIHTHGFR